MKKDNDPIGAFDNDFTLGNNTAPIVTKQKIVINLTALSDEAGYFMITLIFILGAIAISLIKLLIIAVCYTINPIVFGVEAV